MWLSRAQRRQNSLSRAALFVLEDLEQRVLMSVSVASTPVADTLLIVGTKAADTITLGIDGTDSNKIDVTLNGAVTQVDKANIHYIRILAGDGDDTISVDETNGRLPTGINVDAGGGNDVITGSSWNDNIWGGKGNDYINGRGGDNRLYGMKGNDGIWADNGNNYIEGNNDTDSIFTGDGNSTILGGSGNDSISTGTGANSIVGGKGTNHINDSYALGGVLPIDYANGATPLPSNGTAGSVILTPTGLSVLQVRNGYAFGGLNDPTFTNRGQNQAIAIVDAYDDATALTDLTTFSNVYSLPVPTSNSFETVYANGSRPGNDPAGDFGWEGEEALDVQWAHAIAPDAKIFLVEAASASTSDLTQAITVASDILRTQYGGGVVSMSFGQTGGFETESSAWEPIFNNVKYNNITYVASAGDVGGIISYPSTSARVLSVGGTNLQVDANGNRLSESAWTDGGGGISTVIPTPPYQVGMSIGGTPIGPNRAVPDVAYNADPATGVSVYTSFPQVDQNGDGSPDAGWVTIGGTSAGSPQWAGIIALVNQKRKDNGLGLIGNQAVTQIYSLANLDPSSFYNDITSGSNGFPATGGFDLATGWGTPQATPLINALSGTLSGSVGSTGFVWNAEYLEATSKYPGGNVGPLAASFRGTGTADIGFSGVTMGFTLGQEYFGNIFAININTLTRNADGTFFGTGTALVQGPLTSNFLSLNVAGFSTTDANGELELQGSFQSLDPLTGQVPVRGLAESFNGMFSSQ